jgi:hypothetical protein
MKNASGCICEVIILCVDFTTQDFRIKEKNGANFFISSEHITTAFFILASSKLRCFRMFIKKLILPTLVIPVLVQNSTGQSISTTPRNPSLAHNHDSAGSPVN